MIENIFTYRNYEIDSDYRTVSFNYEITQNEEIFSLKETIKFPIELIDSPPLHSALRSLHLALGISYYKIFVSDSLEHPYSMSLEEASFWNKVFEGGLGEFLYVNKLNKARLAKFESQSGIDISSNKNWKPENKALLGIGGGKDSIVAGELLKKASILTNGFVLATGEQLGQTKDVASTMHIDLLAVERSLDKQLLDLQERDDAYRGHIPISLIFGLIGTVLAIATHSKYIVVANESSASIPRVEWQGDMVNHQWSKSLSFETMLQKYINVNISPELIYFSSIRPLGSVAIAKIFADMSQYFQVFTSDNSIFRIDKDKRPAGRWSLESPKSLSSFILLSPWLTEEDLINTFGLNFLDQQTLEKLFYELLEFEGHQPLDCVGTAEELQLSLRLAVSQGKFINSYLVNKARERNQLNDLSGLDDKLNKLLIVSNEHAIPDEIIKRLRPLLGSQPLIKGLEGKDIVFVGLGKGRSIEGLEEYLRSNANIASFKAVDKDNTEQSLDFLKNYDLNKTVFIKNEGIPGSEMTVPYTTPMQLFFDKVSEIGCLTIGITGTKGKSTTTSLTAHILKSKYSDVVLAGNIGSSALSYLENANKDTIFVLELSSYQLSDLKVSPNISACINLYNDHSDWHGGKKKYWNAKKNIIKFSKANDIFIYNPQFEELKLWANETKAKSIAINPEEQLDLSKSELFGDHNRLNALVAIEIAKQLAVNSEDIEKSISSFKPLRHRMEFVDNKNGVIYIDDAIGMTPESTEASMKAVLNKYGQIGCIMLGGKDRNYDFKDLLKFISDAKVPNLVLFPETIEKMKSSMPKDYSPNILETSDMDEAVKFAATNTNYGHVVLLSTAAPSYSIWKDFEDKGNKFKEAVEKL